MGQRGDESEWPGYRVRSNPNKLRRLWMGHCKYHQRMHAILAIDAAWTLTEPSGVALVCSNGTGWHCVAVAPSYDTFVALSLGTNVNWAQTTFGGSPPDATAILAAAQRILGRGVDLITIDMPLATVPIVGRRAADDAISTQFGGRWCSAHTPSASRPGILSDTLTTEFGAAGYCLATSTISEPVTPCLIEVYPHPALLSLMKRAQRVPYKVSKSRRYWPEFTVRQRIAALVKEFKDIRDALTDMFGPVAVPLPQTGDVESLSFLKRYEDALDALVCAWVGVQFLLGRSVPLGDKTAAIWCPRDVVF